MSEDFLQAILRDNPGEDITADPEPRDFLDITAVLEQARELGEDLEFDLDDPPRALLCSPGVLVAELASTGEVLELEIEEGEWIGYRLRRVIASRTTCPRVAIAW
jgi:hypothetical protein